MLFSLLSAHLFFCTQKDLSCPAISQTKEVSCSLYIQFRCTQKIPSYTVGWLVGWLVASFMPIIYIFVTISHACVHFLSKIYIPILPQSEVIVKCIFLEVVGRFLGVSHSPINSIIFASGHKSFGKIDISSLCLRTIRTGVIVLS